MNRRKRVAFGIVLGIAAGLLISSTLIIWMGRAIPSLFFRGYGNMGFIGAVIFGIIVGIIVGYTSLLPEVPWKVIVLVAVVGWPLGFFAPVGVRILQLHLLTSQEIPIYPDGEKLETRVTPIGVMERGPSITLVFRTRANAEEIAQFYQDKLSRREWKADRTGPQLVQVTREGRRLSSLYEFKKHGRSQDGHMFITIREPDSEKFSRVEVSYHLWRNQ